MLSFVTENLTEAVAILNNIDTIVIIEKVEIVYCQDERAKGK